MKMGVGTHNMIGWRIYKKRYYLVLLAFLSACSYFVSWDESVKGGVGRSISDIKETWGDPDDIIALPNGYKEYKYNLESLDPSCVHYWIVNHRGTIMGYRYKGYCRPVG